MGIFKHLLSSSKRAIVGFCLIGIFQVQIVAKGFPSEYYEIEDTDKAKKYFVEYLYKMISKENISIIQEREFVQNYLSFNILKIDFDSPSFYRFLQIKQKYKIKNIYTLQEYLKKIDIIPPSLAIAQAAIESGWGKSRFIKEANNIFGHWTDNSKIGLIPKRRRIGASHFVRVFSNLEESITAYMLNLNRNFAYKAFQEKRYEQRLNEQKLDGLMLSQTMLNYSGIAQDYLKILKDIILLNNLQNFDKEFYQLNLN